MTRELAPYLTAQHGVIVALFVAGALLSWQRSTAAYFGGSVLLIVWCVLELVATYPLASDAFAVSASALGKGLIAYAIGFMVVFLYRQRQ